MSAIKMHTPQTYSRLFRPWDVSKTIIKENENNKIKNESELKIDESSERLRYEYQSIVDTNLYGPSSMITTIPNPIIDGLSQIYTFDNFGDSIYSVPHSSYGPYLSTNGLSPPPPPPPSAALFGVGVDPLTLSLMEHEYARVITEDAQTKALNARKQRPKKFKCPHCDVAFSNNGQLKGHVRIHTGERPFKCDLESCGKTFTRNEELTRHKRIHTGIRPFPCTICGKKFGRRDHLKKHMKTHIPPQEKHLGPAIFVPMYPYLYGC